MMWNKSRHLPAGWTTRALLLQAASTEMERNKTWADSALPKSPPRDPYWYSGSRAGSAVSQARYCLAVEVSGPPLCQHVIRPHREGLRRPYIGNPWPGTPFFRSTFLSRSTVPWHASTVTPLGHWGPFRVAPALVKMSCFGAL